MFSSHCSCLLLVLFWLSSIGLLYFQHLPLALRNMPRLKPHHLALFSLKPVNARAREVVAHPWNSHLVSKLPECGTLVLDIGFNVRSRSSNTLATLGRHDADVFVQGSSIGRLQCSFEIDLDTNIVMLYDRSHSQSTQVEGEGATPFEYGRTRRVVVLEGFNITIGMGGEDRNLVKFEMRWIENATHTLEKIKKTEIFCSKDENFLLARTVDVTPTIHPSTRGTRTHMPGPSQMKIRYAIQGDSLGSGQFGTVHKSVDLDSGKLMAVKILPQSHGATEQEERKRSAMKREVEALSEIRHPHIVDYIASQGWDGPQLEIFMGLKEGTLESLVNGGADVWLFADGLYRQMLQALDCIASKGIIHRDVKPANILYTSHPSCLYEFQLGDFGLCSRAVDANTFAGSIPYMAPELFCAGEQSAKLDVWSLFVTVVWTLDIRRFRTRCHEFKVIGELHHAVFLAASEGALLKIQEMAIARPEDRASAAQMLIKNFDGVGLSTPWNLVPALTTSPSRGMAAARLPGPTRHVLTTQTARDKKRGTA